jgi:hypothetical protein
MMNLTRCLTLLLGGLVTAPAFGYEPPIFPLSEDQLKAYDAYLATPGEKAFAAGPAGQFSAQSGYASATAAVRQALAACDKEGAKPAERCIIIDQNGVRVPVALQLAQQSRADAAALEKDIALRDLTLDTDAWPALAGLEEKPGHKAFAISLRGPWGRSWEASSIEEAEKEALAVCDKNERAKEAKCFILSRDGVRVDPQGLTIMPDLSVVEKKPQQP